MDIKKTIKLNATSIVAAKEINTGVSKNIPIARFLWSSANGTPDITCNVINMINKNVFEADLEKFQNAVNAELNKRGE